MRLHTEYDSAAIPPGNVSDTDRYLLQGRMKSLPAVLGQVANQVAVWGEEHPFDVARAVIAWWLHKSCIGCRGRKFQLLPSGEGLSPKYCKVCRGSGEGKLPYGETGKKISRMMDESVERAQASIKKRLRNMR